MSHKVHHALILLKSLLWDSVISDLIFENGIQIKRVESSAYDTSISSRESNLTTYHGHEAWYTVGYGVPGAPPPHPQPQLYLHIFFSLFIMYWM